MPHAVLQSGIDRLPPGPWAVGVSGGADSVAMLSLLRDRADLQLTVVHLDHETRAEASTGDAAFVAELAVEWQLPAVMARRSEIEPSLVDPPKNAPAMYRACRIALFRRVVREKNLHGVLLAHHADDQAETVLHRLLRGSPPAGLAGMNERTILNGLTIHRPMLGVRRETLRRVLIDRQIPHREDASNASDNYTRNRLRKFLHRRDDLVAPLLAMASASASYRDWIEQQSLTLDPSFRVEQLQPLPAMLATESARRWLIARGAPPAEISAAVIDRLLRICCDAASPSRANLPGAIIVRRRRGVVEALPIDTIGRHES